MIEMTNEWDKTFPRSEKTEHSKVIFQNRFGLELAADMYKPKNTEGRLPAIAVSGPFGAVKEQASGLYAQKLAEYGFLTIAFDPSFTGESQGTPRYMASPDINTEDFQAAVDFLITQENVDEDKIGILCHHKSLCPHFGHFEAGKTIDSLLNALKMTTFKKLPIHSPIMKTNNSIAATSIIYSFYLS